MDLPPSAAVLLVSLAAVFSIVTQRSSPHALRDDTKKRLRGRLDCCCVCKDCRMTLQGYKMKGPGHKDRANPPFCFHRWSHCDARLYSIDFLHWGDFAELKEITVGINRFVSSILCEN